MTGGRVPGRGSASFAPIGPQSRESFTSGRRTSGAAERPGNDGGGSDMAGTRRRGRALLTALWCAATGLVAGGLTATGLPQSARAGTVTVQPPPSAASSAATAPAGGKPDSLCASYGAGFARVAGTSTCVKVGGFVQMDGYNQNLGGATNPGALEPALRSQ